MDDNEKREEIQNLKKELSKLQQDKDFVWNLWKNLQLSSPDLTSAMNMIVEREKEKHDNHISDLIEQGNTNNKTIDQLEASLKLKNTEIAHLKEERSKSAKRIQLLEKQCKEVSDKAEQLSNCIAVTENKHDYRELIKSYEQERQNLLDTISRLQTQISRNNDEMTELKLEAIRSQDMKKEITELRKELKEADENINNQCETIEILREQVIAQKTLTEMENNNYRDRNKGIHNVNNGYWSDSTHDSVEIKESPMYSNESQNNKHSLIKTSGNIPNKTEMVEPVTDLNYKVEKLSHHMNELVKSLENKSSHNPLSGVTKKWFKRDPQKEDMARKLNFLSNKLQRVEQEFSEQKKICETAKDTLTKSNSRVKSLQLSLKQCRTQLDDNKDTERQLKFKISQLEEDLRRSNQQVREQKLEVDHYRHNSIEDGKRIQELMKSLESASIDAAEKTVEMEVCNNQTCRQLEMTINSLERDKFNLENDLKQLKCKLADIENDWLTKVSNQKTRAGRVRSLSKTCFKKGQSRTKPAQGMRKILDHFSVSKQGIRNEDHRQDGDNQQDEYDDEYEETTEEEVLSEETVIDKSAITDRSTASTTLSLGEQITQIARNENYRPNRGKEIKRKRSYSNKRSSNFQPSPSPNRKSNMRLSRATSNPSNQTCHSNSAIKNTQKTVVICEDCKNVKWRMESLRQQMKAVSEDREQYKSKIKKTISKQATLENELIQSKARAKRLLTAVRSQSRKMNALLEERQQFFQNSSSSCEDNNNMFFNYNNTNNNNKGGKTVHYEESIVDDDDDECFDLEIHRQEMIQQVQQVKMLKQQLFARDTDLQRLRNKLSKTEKELTNKRRICDDQKTRLTMLETMKDQENKYKLQKETNLQNLQDSNYKLKIQLSSLQTRLDKVSEERKKFEIDSFNSQTKLSMTELKLNELRQAKTMLENQVNRTEKEADERVRVAVKQGANNTEKTEAEIQKIRSRTQRYEQLVLTLARTVSDKVREIRRLIDMSHQLSNAPNNASNNHQKNNDLVTLGTDKANCDDDKKAMEIAKSRAASILSLSSSEIESILSPASSTLQITSNSSNSTHRSNKNTDSARKYNHKKPDSNREAPFEIMSYCKKAFKKESFDEEIQGLFSEKLDEVVELIAPVYSDSGCMSS